MRGSDGLSKRRRSGRTDVIALVGAEILAMKRMTKHSTEKDTSAQHLTLHCVDASKHAAKRCLLLWVIRLGALWM